MQGIKQEVLLPEPSLALHPIIAILVVLFDKQTYISELKDIEINPNFKSDYCRDTKGEKNGRAKLNNEKVLEIIKLIQSKKYSLVEIAKMYNVTPTSISAIKNKKTWKHLTKNITFN